MDAAARSEHLITVYAGLGYNPVGLVPWSGKVYRIWS
jgi:hypothetical protein